VKVVGREKLTAFCRKHSDAKDWIDNWLADVESAIWANPRDIRATYASVSFLDGNTVIFNVKGNRYRLEAIAAFRTGTIGVVWVGTHNEYDIRNRERR
jgi:mRNA interferase HigB